MRHSTIFPTHTRRLKCPQNDAIPCSELHGSGPSALNDRTCSRDVQRSRSKNNRNRSSRSSSLEQMSGSKNFGGNGYHNWSNDVRVFLGARQPGIAAALKCAERLRDNATDATLTPLRPTRRPGCESGGAAVRTAVWSFDRLLLNHFGNSILLPTVFLLVSPLSIVTTVALKLRTPLVFTLVLSFALVLAFLALGVRVPFLPCLRTHRRFPFAFLPLALNGLAAMTVLPMGISTVCHTMAQSGREPQVSNRCVLSSFQSRSHILQRVSQTQSFPKSKCMISCSCAKERACEWMMAHDVAVLTEGEGEGVGKKADGEGVIPSPPT